jgi:hypothetical protein
MNDTGGIDHDVLFIQLRNPGRETERDNGRIHVEMTKRDVNDGEFLEFVDMMINITTRRTHQVRGKIRHFVIKVRVQSLHIRKFRGELFLLLQQLSEFVIELFQPETISHDCGIVLYLCFAKIATSSARRVRFDSNLALASLRRVDII